MFDRSRFHALTSPHPRGGRRLPFIGAAALVGVLACEKALPGDPDVSATSAPSRAVAGSSAIAATAARVSSGVGAADQCPPMSFVTGINLAKNPSFEIGTGPVSWPPGPTPPKSAASSWYMHTSNQNDVVYSSRVQTTVPGPGGSRMLYFRAGGNEGGVYQVIPTAPNKVMFSAWVYVRTGHVVIGANATTGMTPYSWSTKHGEWEQLRVCTDGTFPTQWFFIENEDPNGGSFYVDRVEVMEIP